LTRQVFRIQKGAVHDRLVGGQCIRRRNLVVGAWVALLMALGAVQTFGCGQSPMSFARQIVRL
jgi:hypothetical protein